MGCCQTKDSNLDTPRKRLQKEEEATSVLKKYSPMIQGQMLVGQSGAGTQMNSYQQSKLYEQPMGQKTFKKVKLKELASNPLFTSQEDIEFLSRMDQLELEKMQSTASRDESQYQVLRVNLGGNKFKAFREDSDALHVLEEENKSEEHDDDSIMMQSIQKQELDKVKKDKENPEAEVQYFNKDALDDLQLNQGISHNINESEVGTALNKSIAKNTADEILANIDDKMNSRMSIADMIKQKQYVGYLHENINEEDESPTTIDVQMKINTDNHTLTGIINQSDIKSIIEGEYNDQTNQFNFRITNPNRISFVEANYQDETFNLIEGLLYVNSDRENPVKIKLLETQ